MREEMKYKLVQKLLSIICIIGLIICIAGKKEQPSYPLGKNSLFDPVAGMTKEIIDEMREVIAVLKEEPEPPTSAEEAYIRMENGDWSMVESFDQKEWLASSWTNYDFVRTDLNEDGVPELVAYYYYKGDQERDERPLSYIFSYEDSTVKMVLNDLVDASGYYFLGANGKLIYTYRLGGVVCHGTYWQIQFDQQWSEKSVYSLSYLYFDEEEYYDEEEIQWLKEQYQDSYGTEGSGVYCYEDKYDGRNERRISEAEFHRAYEELTGFSFMENLPYAEWIWEEYIEGVKNIETNLQQGGLKEEEKNILRRSWLEEGIFAGDELRDGKRKMDGILSELLYTKGELSEGNSAYFSNFAKKQLEEINWTELNIKWDKDGEEEGRGSYDSFCIPHLLWANSGYEFVYIYQEAVEGVKSDPNGELTWIRLLVSDSGIVQGLSTGQEKMAEMNPWLIGGLEADTWFVDAYIERVVLEGKPETGKILTASPTAGSPREPASDSLPEKGLSGEASASMQIQDVTNVSFFSLVQTEEGYIDVSLAASYVGEELIIRLTGNMTEGTEKPLPEGWLASPYYDAWYYPEYSTENGLAFVYYVYPDFTKMNTDSSQALILHTMVDKESGEITILQKQPALLEKEEYQEKLDKIDTRFLIVEDAPKDYNLIEVADIPGSNENLYWEAVWKEGEEWPIGEYVHPRKSDRYVAIDTGWQEAGKACMAAGWEADGYDIYYYNQNQYEGQVHFRYYYHWKKEGSLVGKTLAMDVWLSEEGVEDTREVWFFTRKENKAELSHAKERLSGFSINDIEPYLKTDWTSYELLTFYDSDIQPAGSGWGWDFSLADIDFNGSLEMLITFPYWPGGNSLYVYRIQEGKMVPWFATYATMGGIVSDFDPMEISSRLDIDLLGIYVNEAGEYRYLSTDDNMHGGDIRGNWGGFSLYETRLESGTIPEKILEVNYVYPGEYLELYFKGERVYGRARLGELLEEYMAGYQPVEWSYATAQTHFPREMTGWELKEGGKEAMQELLEALYEDLRRIVGE